MLLSVIAARAQSASTGRPLAGALLWTGVTYSTSQLLLVPSLPVIQRAIGTSPIGANALMSAFFISGAATAGIVGRLGDMFGKRRMLLVEMALFSAGALICLAAGSLPALLFGRIVMGSATGLFALSFSVIGDQFRPNQVPRMLTLMGATIGVGMVTGLMISGPVTAAVGYRGLFAISIAMGASSLAAIAAVVPESPLRAGGSVDVTGALLLAAGVVGPMLAVSLAATTGLGDPRCALLAVSGPLLLAGFVAYERWHAAPLVHLPTMIQPTVLLTNVATVLMGFGMFGSIIIFLQFLQVPASTGYGYGLDASHASRFLLPGALLVLFLSPVSGRLLGWLGAKRTLLTGTAMSATALALLTAIHRNAFVLHLCPTLMLLGNSLAFSATPAMILSAVSPYRRAQSTGVNLIARLIGSSLGTLAAAAFVTASAKPTGVASQLGYVHAFAAQAIAATSAFAIVAVTPSGGSTRAGLRRLHMWLRRGQPSTVTVGQQAAEGPSS